MSSSYHDLKIQEKSSFLWDRKQIDLNFTNTCLVVLILVYPASRTVGNKHRLKDLLVYILL